MISTGMDGPAFLTCLPLSSMSARIFPYAAADDDDVADAQRSVLNEHGRDRAAAAVERRFDDDARRATVLVGLELFEIGLEQHGFEQLIDPAAIARRDRHHLDLAAPFDGLQTFVGQLLLDAIGLSVFLVHLVDGDDDRHAGRFDMRNRFARLRHDAVVGGHDENRDVGDLGAARTHRGERLVTGRVDERDLAIVLLDGVRTDLLSDAAGFAGRDRWRCGSCRAATFCRGRRGRAR